MRDVPSISHKHFKRNFDLFIFLKSLILILFKNKYIQFSYFLKYIILIFYFKIKIFSSLLFLQDLQFWSFSLNVKTYFNHIMLISYQSCLLNLMKKPKFTKMKY